MKTFIFSFSLLLIISLFKGCNASKSILLVSGGHAYDTTAFYDMFRSLEGIEFDSVSYPNAKEVLKSGKLDAYDVLVYYDFVPDMPMQDSAIFLELAKKGKPMLFLHHAICTFQEWDGYRQMIGGKYVMPDYSTDTTRWSDYKHDIDLQIEVADRNHPITGGISTFTIHDEGYSNISLLEGVNPLLRTDHPDCFSLVGWTNTFKKSSIVYLMFGHDQMAYANDSFRLLLGNSIRWLSEKNE